MSEPLPVLILAGSDQRRGPVHPELQADDMLSGFKGAIPLPWGKCLAAELIDRLRHSGRFRDPILIGPRAVYDSLVDCEIVDVEGTLVATLQTAQHCIATRLASDAPVAVTACDILPTPQEFRDLLDEGYETNRDCHFWWQMITAAPAELGASSWKPRYVIQAEPGETPQPAYPGHLVIFRPEALRAELLNRLLSLAYRYRNRPIQKRVLPMLFRGVGMLAAQDLRNLRVPQFPLLTFSIPWHILSAYTAFRRGSLSVPSLEKHLGRVLLHRHFRQAHRPLVVTLSPILTFAQDIDAKAELAQIIARGPVG